MSQNPSTFNYMHFSYLGLVHGHFLLSTGWSCRCYLWICRASNIGHWQLSERPMADTLNSTVDNCPATANVSDHALYGK